jgi:hypothetical protein
MTGLDGGEPRRLDEPAAVGGPVATCSGRLAVEVRPCRQQRLAGVLTADHGRVHLVVPGDRTPARALPDVSRIGVAVSDATPATPPAGSVVVGNGHRTTTVTATQLAHLPAPTVTATFGSGTGQQTHTERGPALAAVLAIAGMPVGPRTSIVAVGSDGYGTGSS